MALRQVRWYVSDRTLKTDGEHRSMHITVAWDIEATPDRIKAINGEMKAALQGFSWVRALSSLYIVKLDDLDDRDTINEKLKSVANEAAADEKVHFLISPAMDGGRYQGWLPKRLWPKINARIDD
jgi:hypothetical protein